MNVLVIPRGVGMWKRFYLSHISTPPIFVSKLKMLTSIGDKENAKRPQSLYLWILNSIGGNNSLIPNIEAGRMTNSLTTSVGIKKIYTKYLTHPWKGKTMRQTFSTTDVMISLQLILLLSHSITTWKKFLFLSIMCTDHCAERPFLFSILKLSSFLCYNSY